MLNCDLELSNVKKNVAVVPAAGVGKRFDSQLPKQYHLINGRIVLDCSLELFVNSEHIEKVLLIVSPEDSHYKKLQYITHEKLIVIDGGDERQDSVNNGLRYLYDNGLPDDVGVFVHDAVRPCLALEDLELLIKNYNDSLNY